MSAALSIEFPRDVGPEALEPLLLRMRAILVPYRALGRPARAALELVGDRAGVSIELWLERESLAPVAAQALRSAWPAGRVQNRRPRRYDDRFQVFGRLSLGRNDAPLRDDLGASALGGILSPLSELRGEQQAVVQLALAPAPPAAQGRLLARARELERRGTRGSLIGGLAALEANRPRAGATREKAATPLFRTSVLVAASDGFLVRDIATAFAQFAAPYAQVRHHRVHCASRARAQLRGRGLALWPAPTLVGARELACLLAPSSEALRAVRGPLLRTRRLAPPQDAPTAGRVLCVGERGGRQRPVAISRIDSRSHVALIGPTNVGKTTTQVNFFLQAVAAGDGGVFIEPAKGDAIEAILVRLSDRDADRAIVVDPEREREHPPGLNLLESLGGDRSEPAAALLAVLRDLHESSWGARLDDTAYNGLATAAAVSGVTVAELPALYASREFRRPFVAELHDPFIRDWWRWFDRLSDAERAQITAPVLNKLRPLLRPALLPIVAQRESTIRFDEILRERRILLLRLPPGGELFGALVVAALWRAVERRALVPEERRPDTVLCIDEVHRFLRVGGDVAEMLALARGLRLSLCLATQHLEQCPPALRAALLHNARTRLAFQTSFPDATTLARTFAPELEAVDLANLERFGVAARVAVGGAVSAPFTATTLPLPDPVRRSSEPLRAASRRRYGRSRAEVYADLERRLAGRSDSGDLAPEAIGTAPV